ncbi:MAG: IS110 family transposase [Acidimicrobiales bacterium]
MTIVADTPIHVDELEVTLGVDTHADTHVAAVIDRLGRHLSHGTFDTDVAGCEALLVWANQLGTISIAGVEGTGAYGAGLARFDRGRRRSGRGRPSRPQGTPLRRQVRPDRR